MSRDLIDRQTVINALDHVISHGAKSNVGECHFLTAEGVKEYVLSLPPAQPERLTDEDFETIRIHLNAWKEKLCNQQRWKEAEEYQRIINRFMSFASAQPEPKTGKWIKTPEFCGDDVSGFIDNRFSCSECKKEAEINPWGFYILSDFCPHCGADMRGEHDGDK